MNASPLIVTLKILAHGVGLDLPKYETIGSAGMDLRAAVLETEPIILNPGARAVIPSGLALAIPLGWEGQVRPRSGLALKKGVTVLNAPGTIDSDYRGELGVILINHGRKPFTIRRGERIAQFIMAQVSQCQWKVVSELDSTQRNEDGFGSTGQ
ncbi:MAG: dUTP diphosphatase [Magnetococcales bacterium]|nr:dUTP diphosphatase [Magnetococcales bacterium]